MRYGYSILYVDNVEATLAFYEEAFGLRRRLLAEGQSGELETGSTVLAFAQAAFAHGLHGAPFTVPTAGGEAPPVELGLVTEEVESAFQRAVAAGAVPVKPPVRKPWGQLVGYVRDCNGFLVEICSPLDAG